jgi:hypothetical protein
MHQDAEEFLGLYLDALDEELVELHTYISTLKLASPCVEELDGETQSAEGQAEVAKREYTVHVRRLCFFFSALSLTFMTYAWTRIGTFSRVAHLAHIRWKVPFDRSRAKPARHRHCPSLAITQTLYPGPFLLLSPPSTRRYFLVTNFQTLRAARFGAHHSRRTCTRHAAPTGAGRPIQLERGESSGASRGASTDSRPPS